MSKCEVVVLTDKEILNKVSALLKKHNYKIAVAESCTGGLISNNLTDISGSSEYFDRGIVSYSNSSKIELLSVSEELIIKHGAVSSEVAEAMADGVRHKSNVDIGLSTTGIAGPTGGTSGKPVGLVFIAVSTKKNTMVKKFNFNGKRLDIKKQACEASLKMLLDVLE